jgi:hypothetical protein
LITPLLGVFAQAFFEKACSQAFFRKDLWDPGGGLGEAQDVYPINRPIKKESNIKADRQK